MSLMGILESDYLRRVIIEHIKWVEKRGGKQACFVGFCWKDMDRNKVTKSIRFTNRRIT